LDKRPFIGITMGDPAGIGPEILVMALADGDVYQDSRPVVLGDLSVLSAVVSDLPLRGLRKLSLNVISRPAQAEAVPGVIDLMAVSELSAGTIQPGRPTLAGGRAMVAYIFRAVEMTLQGGLAAMVTCPISKALMHRAGHRFDGHTQLISHLTGTPDYVMMLAGDTLRVALVTIHCALNHVAGLLNREMVYKTIMITHKALKDDFGLKTPRLAVAALNPHGGEAGLFGSEEETVIGPAIEMARAEGAGVEGPFPADTLFHKAAAGQYDTVVAM